MVEDGYTVVPHIIACLAHRRTPLDVPFSRRDSLLSLDMNDHEQIPALTTTLTN